MSSTDQFTSPAPNTENSGARPSIGELVGKISAQVSALVRDEIKHAGIQMKAKVSKLAVGGVLIIVAAILALYMLSLLLFAAVAAFAKITSLWLAFLIVAGILLLLIVILLLVGINRIKASEKHQFNPQEGIGKDIDAVKKGLNK